VKHTCGVRPVKRLILAMAHHATRRGQVSRCVRASPFFSADPLAALLMAPIIAKEGIDGIQGKACHAVECLFEYDPPVWTEGAAEGCMIPDHIVRINVENAAEADTLGERRLSNEHVHCRDSGNGATQYHRPLCSGNSASRD
jgi:hypothetical protein